MKNFKIIPVLDIFNSKAVHAKKGEREKYKPLKSNLFNTQNPMNIINILSKELKFEKFYIADLNGITNRNPNLKLLEELLEIPKIEILLDPGIFNIGDIKIFSNFNIKLIIGLETIKNFKIINEGLKIFGQTNLIISIDMYKGKIITKAKDLVNMKPILIIKKLGFLGIKNIILLDLFRVGQKLGGIPPSYLQIVKEFDGNIIVGGGIKNYDDIINYREKKFSGVLIATALYDGSISAAKIKQLNEA